MDVKKSNHRKVIFKKIMAESNQVQAVTFGHKKMILPTEPTNYAGNAKTQFSQKALIQVAWDCISH